VDKHEDRAAGEQIGRDVGAAMLALAATDNYLAQALPPVPVGSGYWKPSSAAIVRSLYGTRPFFMTSTDEFRPPPPPVFGSPEYTTALAEIRTISDGRTAEQLAIAKEWNTGFTASAWNVIADNLITSSHTSERQAARILAYANAAAFDAQIACFDAKFTYWFIRPSQADSKITLPIGLPNHPSYPSAHSCISAGLGDVLAAAFPTEETRMDSLVTVAGLSRMYGGLHYSFDVAAGQQIGRQAAAAALVGSLECDKVAGVEVTSVVSRSAGRRRMGRCNAGRGDDDNDDVAPAGRGHDFGDSPGSR
jgi:membrane-associated phospholipid phosphatase